MVCHCLKEILPINHEAQVRNPPLRKSENALIIFIFIVNVLDWNRFCLIFKCFIEKLLYICTQHMYNSKINTFLFLDTNCITKNKYASDATVGQEMALLMQIADDSLVDYFLCICSFF